MWIVLRHLRRHFAGSQCWRREITAVFSSYKFGDRWGGWGVGGIITPYPLPKIEVRGRRPQRRVRRTCNAENPKEYLLHLQSWLRNIQFLLDFVFLVRIILFWCYGNNENRCTKLHGLTSGIWMLRLALVPRRKPYRLEILFTEKNGDFGAISVTARSYAAPRIVIFRKGFCATLWYSVNRFSETLVVYHSQKFFGKSGWNVNGTPLLRSFQRKVSGSNEHLKR